MIFTKDELIKTLRQAVNVENSDVSDSAYLNMTDDDLMLFINLGVSKCYPNFDSVDDLSDGSAYPVILISKKELYLKLAVTSAPLYDITADNNNSLHRSQRFDHYIKLAENAQDEYDDWKEYDDVTDPVTGITGVRTYDVLLNKMHYSERNYRLAVSPIVRIKLKESGITSDSVEFSWTSANSEHFGKFLVYVSTKQIVDMYRSGAKAEDKICDGAKLILSTFNYHNNYKRIEGLEPSTIYHVAVIAVERNQRFGYKEVEFTTLEEVSGEEVNVSSIGE